MERADVQPGASAFARIHLEAPAVLVRGDRFILRAYSPLTTIAGGVVLDPWPPRRGVRTAAGAARFAQLADGTTHAAVAMAMIEEAGLSGLPDVQLVGRAGVPWTDRDRVVTELDGRIVRIGTRLVSASRLGAAEDAMLAAVAQHHADHPTAGGMPREELRERVFGRTRGAVFDHALHRLVEQGRIVARERVSLPGKRIALNADEARTREAILQMLGDAGLTPPDPGVLATRISVKRDLLDRVAELLVRQKEIVRVGELLFHSTALAQLKTEIRALKQHGAIATLDVAAFKQRYNVSRKYAIPLLEFLDSERITRRVGDVRQIL
jgi:selenocysteine-specific elongation factor